MYISPQANSEAIWKAPSVVNLGGAEVEIIVRSTCVIWDIMFLQLTVPGRNSTALPHWNLATIVSSLYHCQPSF